jgi:hypothetical protein
MTEKYLAGLEKSGADWRRLKKTGKDREKLKNLERVGKS